ncbi:MAG: ATP-binding protein [Lachnospiraceae bacterium]|nr:ATP-binding protein [Lachnospiraceae bacterium]
MGKRKKLPVGIENFPKLREEDFYYVDKSGLIEILLNNWGEVNLFTRPRRFGKSLNMSMLRHFFEIGTDPSLFDGLSIAQNQELCQKFMGKYPVISISLKGVDTDNYEDARKLLVKIMNREARRLRFLLDSDRLCDLDKSVFMDILDKQMDEDTLVCSLQELSELLELHYGEKVIILIDEYDVPLAKANENGYYDEMVLLIRNMLGNALKTNDSLKFAVLTGCLRIAKESIFTGLNNFNIYSITNKDFDEYFGFTDTEVSEMLKYYGIEDHYEIVKEWYDGYRFGDTEVYCPWDVINYCKDHLSTPSAAPKNYWMNTSGNDVINHFIDCLDHDGQLTRSELEALVNGGTIQKQICEELTYRELYSTIDNLWSTLFMTGYLTQRGSQDGELYDLAIPNREVRNIIISQIMTRFKQEVQSDGETVRKFCNALFEGRPEEVEQLFREYMKKTISVRDTFVQKSLKENFYHGILLGILSFKDGWMVRSNRESGNGFSDIMIRIDDSDTGIIIEVKYDEKADLETECKEALRQIDDTGYTEALHQEEIHRILKYGIACRRKDCRVLMEIEC